MSHISSFARAAKVEVSGEEAEGKGSDSKGHLRRSEGQVRINEKTLHGDDDQHSQYLESPWILVSHAEGREDSGPHSGIILRFGALSSGSWWNLGSEKSYLTLTRTSCKTEGLLDCTFFALGSFCSVLPRP